MSDIKQKALDKMLEEMNQPHSETEDYIHNWLCVQDDDRLFEAILKEGKSINDSLNYLIEKAQKGSNGKRSAVMSDQQGFEVIVDYFMGNETSIKNVGVASATTTPPAAKTEPKKEVKPTVKKVAKTDSSPILSIFDFGTDDTIPVIESPESEEDVDDTDYEDE